MFLYVCDTCKRYTLKVDRPDFPCFPNRILTVQKICDCGTHCRSAHPARFSPDDKFSEQRITLKKRFNLLPTQQPAVKY